MSSRPIELIVRAAVKLCLPDVVDGNTFQSRKHALRNKILRLGFQTLWQKSYPKSPPAELGRMGGNLVPGTFNSFQMMVIHLPYASAFI